MLILSVFLSKVNRKSVRQKVTAQVKHCERTKRWNTLEATNKKRNGENLGTAIHETGANSQILFLLFNIVKNL